MMRTLLLMLLLILPLVNIHASCVVAIPDDCTSGQVCAKYNARGDSKCFDVPEKAPIVFDLPFDSETSVICAQSGRFSTASHIYRNMLYAIDLATPYEKRASVVRASAEGKAFVVTGCPTPEGTVEQSKADPCGEGYGNHVRILHANGYVSLYAHLGEIFVKTGETVKKHQRLGTESTTGMAGYRHLHWDVHKLEVPAGQWEKHLANPGWGGVSVPFDFNITINGKKKVVNSGAIACRWLDMKQPAWSGTY